MLDFLSPAGLPRRRGLPGFSAAGARWNSLGVPSPPHQPRYETGYFEQGVTNLMAGKTEFQNTGNISTGWSGYQGSVPVVTPGQSDPAGGVTAHRIQASGGTHLIKYYTSVGSYQLGEQTAHRVWVRKANAASPDCRVESNVLGATVGSVLVSSTAWTEVILYGTATVTAFLQMQFRSINVGDSLDICVWRPQIERGKIQPGPYTGTSRPTIYGSGAITMEESRKNDAKYSDPQTAGQFASLTNGFAVASGPPSVPWLKGGASIADGVPSATAAAYVDTPSTLLHSTTYVVSLFVEMNDGLAPTNFASGGGDFTLAVNFNPIAGSAVTVQRVSDRVFRVWGTYTTPASGTVWGSHGPVKYSTSNARGFRVSGYQLEVGTYPTSYHPTNGAAATRAVETYLIDNPQSAIPLLGEGSLSVVFKPGPGFFGLSSGGGWRRIIGHSTAMNTNEIELMQNAATSTVAFAISNNAASPQGSWQNLISTTALSVDVTYHIVCTWSASAGRYSLYVNGVLEGQKALTPDKIPTVYGKLAVGHHPETPTRSANGLIGAIRFFSKELSPAEALSLYVADQFDSMSQWLTFWQPFRRPVRGLAM